MMWVKNTDGKRDSALTFSLVAFVVIVIKVLLGGTEAEFLGWTLSVQPIGADVIAALLGCTMGTYAMRRHTDRKFPRVDDEQYVVVEGPEGGK